MAQTEPKQRLEQLENLRSEGLSLRKRTELLGVNRSTLYYQAKPKDVSDVELLNRIRDIWLRWPFYGYRRVTVALQRDGYAVNRKRVQRLMRIGGIEAIYPGPNTSRRNHAHAVHPYLLKEITITKPNQAWMTDITYLRMNGGFMYLIAFIDVHSRYVVGWTLSNTMDTDFCIEGLMKSLGKAKPEVINSDQGSQFTSEDWVVALRKANVLISMTGKGRCHDNIYIERFWRSVKWEEFYLNDYPDVASLKCAIESYITFYNNERCHQSLNYETPAKKFFEECFI